MPAATAIPPRAGAGPLSQIILGFRIGRLAIALVVIVLGAFVALQLKGGPATSSDGAFSLTVPSGWQRISSPASDQAGTPVLVLAAPVANGIEPHFIVDQYQQFISLDAINDAWPATMFTGNQAGQGSMGLPAPTTVGGLQALMADARGPTWQEQVGVVDYQGKTYIIFMTSDTNHFETFRSGDFAKILASWHWSNPPPQ